ncbi:putative ribonuclease H-like domain-containing protein [Tanacetum coccineum]
MSVPVIDEEKTNKKNDVNARSLLLIALPNEHQLTFSQYNDAKIMFAAIKTQFGGSRRLLMNKAEIKTMSIDNLYNNFKIIEQSVMKSVGASSGAQNLAFMTAPSTSSTNDVNTAKHVYEVSTFSPNVNTASPQISTVSFSDNVVYAFMVENPNGSNLLQQDLEQIHEDDLKAMDLKWELSLLSMRAKRYFQRTGKNIFINANDTDGYDKSKVECFNCHKMGHFSGSVEIEEQEGFNWSDMAEEHVQTNMALMAFSDTKGYNDKTCFKTSAIYKRGLATVEDQLITYRKNEVLFSEEVAVLKRSKLAKIEINVLKVSLKNASKENSDDSLVKEQVSKDTSRIIDSPLMVDKETVFLDKKIEFVKPKNHEKPVKKSVRYAEMYRSQRPRGNQRNWNGQKSNQLGNDFVMYNKACFICGNFDHVQAHCKYHQRERVVYGNKYNRVYYNYTTNRTHPNAQRNMVPRAVLMKIGLKPFNTARTVNTAHPKSTVFSSKPMSSFSKSTQSTVRRPFQSKTVLSNKRFTQTNNTAKAKAVNTARPEVVNTARPHSTVVNVVRVNQANAVKASTCWVWRPTKLDSALITLKKHDYIDARGRSNGCSRHMTGNMAYLLDFKEFDGGYVTFRGGAHGGRISGKGTLKTDSLDFEDVYFVNELKFNFFSVSQMCDKKNILFTDTECLVLSPNFKLPDETQILLKIPRKDNMYSFYMKNIVPKESLTCLVAEATLDESMLWHKRLGHINFKNINKLVKDNLVRGLPTKRFENDQTCIACLKGKQHRASCKSKVLNPITNPLFMLHMDLFGPTFNSVAERRNKTLIEAARTMLADSKLPTTFWAKANSTACYVHNRVLVVKPNSKTPYELFRCFKPALNFMRPFGCHVTILNTLDNLGMFDGKSDEGTQGELNVGTSTQKEEINQDCIVMPVWKGASYFDSPFKDVGNGKPKSAADDQKQVEDGSDNENDEQDKSEDDSSPKEVNAAGQHVNTASPEVNTGSFKLSIVDPSVSIASSNDQDRPKDMFKWGASHILEITHVEFFSDKDEPEVDLGNITNFYTIEPTSIAKALSDLSWVKAMQEELLQFKLQQVWKLMDLPNRKRVIGTKWVCKNKKDERGIMIRNKARLVTQGHRQEEGIDYEEVFAPVARIEAIRLFLAYASFMGFLVYQMDVKSAFLYGTIEKDVFVTQSPGFKDPDHPDKVYKVVKALYGLHQAPRAWYETLANYSLGNRFKKGKIDQTLFFKMKKGDIFLVHVYVDDIIFGSINKELCTGFEKLMKDNFQMSSMGELTFFLGLQSASTLVDLEKPLVKDGDANDVDIHLYRSIIGSLMLISWQCKKQTVVANSTTEAEYVAAASCCGQVLWIQNQLLDYRYNFMNTIINIDNNSTICIIENPVQHSKTKHIEIRHHFIRDCNAKKLIQMVKIHTDYNVADLLTKGFDAGRF